MIFSHFNQSDHFFHQVILRLSFLIFVKKPLSETLCGGTTIDWMGKVKHSHVGLLFLVF